MVHTHSGTVLSRNKEWSADGSPVQGPWGGAEEPGSSAQHGDNMQQHSPVRFVTRSVVKFSPQKGNGDLLTAVPTDTHVSRCHLNSQDAEAS